MKKALFRDLLIISLLVGVIYGNSFAIGFIWDDLALILDNAFIRNPANLWRSFGYSLSAHSANFYRPIQSLSYIADFFFYKFDYRGYHLTNILLHIAVSLLSYLILLNLSADRRLSLFSSLIFAASPLWVESVSYISGRADMLMAVFIFSSLLFFIRGKIFSAFVCYLPALFSKEAAVVYPLLALFSAALFGRMQKKNIAAVMLFFFASALYAILRLNPLPSVDKVTAYPLYIRMLIFIKAAGKYLTMLFLPLGQHMSQSILLPDSFWRGTVLAPFSLLVFLFFIFARNLKRQPLISFFIGWFFIMLIPYTGLWRINACFAEHFIYAGAIGIYATFVYFLQKKGPLGIAVILSYIAVFSFATIRYNSLWQDEAVFYERIIRLSPRSLDAYNNLAVVYLKRQNFKKAEELIRRTIALDASCWEARLNLSRLYYLQGQLDQAIVIAQGVLRDDPGNYFCLNYLGTYYFKKKDFASAEDCFKRAVKANSRLNSLLMDLCLFYRFTGRDKEADELEAQIGALDRYGVAKLYFMQARSFFENGSNLQALAAIEKAIAIEPRNSDFYNLKGCILKKQGEFSLALEDFRKALELGPENWEVYNNLGNLFALNKDLRSAESFYQRAVSLNSGFADGYFNLGLICLERKDYSRAEEFFRKAVSLAGAHPLAEEQLEKIPPRVRQH